jgi:hypothetical protein
MLEGVAVFEAKDVLPTINNEVTTLTRASLTRVRIDRR